MDNREVSSVAEAVARGRQSNNIPDDLVDPPVATLDELFRYAAEHYADRPAYHCLYRTLTFAELDRLSDAFAAFLQSDLGLERGSRVALHMPNLLQYPVAAMGVIKAGLVLVNTNPLYTADELRHQLQDAGVSAIVTLLNIAIELEEVAKELNDLVVITTEVADLHGVFRRALINGVLRYVRREVPSLEFPGSVTFRDALRRGRDLQYERHSPSREDLVLLQYTGGTTGVAKGAMLTHGSLTDCMLQTDWLYRAAGMIRGEMSVVIPLPLYHIYAFSTGFTHVLFQGSRAILIVNARDMDAFVGELARHRFHALFGLNTLFSALLNHRRIGRVDFSSVLLTVSGGMPLSASLAERWRARTGVQISEGYGLTESSGILSFNPPGNVRMGTAGVGFPGCEFRIEGDDGTALGVDQEGELCFRGRQMMKGYWQRPEATSELMDADGFMRTGDIARIDADGYITICDRKKDMIIVSGFKIFPSEVEEVVRRCEGVSDCAVVGAPDDDGNERVALYVVRSDPSLTREKLLAHCREHLTAYKVPKIVEFVSELPQSHIGKVLRRKVRDVAASGETPSEPHAT